MDVFQFNEDYKADMKSESVPQYIHSEFKDEILAKAFQDVVSWCLKAEIEKLKEGLNKPPFSYIMFSNIKDKTSGYNLREIVAATGKVEVMKIIHEDQNLCLYLGKSLDIALSNEDFKMVCCILSRKVPQVPKIRQSLFNAYQTENFEMLQEIVHYMKDTKAPNDKFNNFAEVLFHAISDERLPVVKLLVQNGADLNEERWTNWRFSCGITTLCAAMNTGNFEIVEYLINNGSRKFLTETSQDDSIEFLNLRISWLKDRSDSNLKNVEKIIDSMISIAEKMTVLNHQAFDKVVERNRLRIVKILISHMNTCKEVEIPYPLHCAIQVENYYNIEFLLTNEVSVLVRDKTNKLPLDHLKEKDLSLLSVEDKWKVKHLISVISSKMSDQSATNESSKLPFVNSRGELLTFHWVQCAFDKTCSQIREGKDTAFIREEDKDLIHYLIKSDYHNHHGKRLIDCAAYEGETKIVKKLLQLGANVEVLSNDGKVLHSAIDMAVSGRHQHVVKCLFEHGVKVEDQMSLAVEKNNLEVAEYILDKVDIKAISPKYKMNALHLASTLGRLNFVKFLIHNGAEVNAKCPDDSKTPLHYAAINLHYVELEYLVKKGADISHKDKDKLTALDYARKTTADLRARKKMIICLEQGNEEAIIKSRSSKKRRFDDSSSTDNTTSSSDSEDQESRQNETRIQLTKSKKTFVDKSTMTDNMDNDITRNQESKSPDDMSLIVRNLKETFLKKDSSFSRKITCLSAIDPILSRESNICLQIAEKEVIDEIASLVREIVSRNDVQQNSPNKDLVVIARILAKLNSTSEGKKLIGDMNLSFSAFEMLKAEMKKFEIDPHPSQFAFDSDCKRIKKEL